VKWIIFVILLWFMLYDSNRFVRVDYTFKDKRIKKKCRAVVLADLHNKSFGKQNEKLLAAIAEYEPDFILIPGDIPTAHPNKSLDVATHFIQELSKKYTIYYANGNHEHRMRLYPETYGDMYSRYEKVLRDAGVVHLINSNTQLKEYGICIYGAEIDKYYYKRFGIKPMPDDYMPEILGTPSGEWFNVLLAHNPDYFLNYASWGSDLTLAGHVHGGVIRIPFWGRGLLSPNVRFFPKYDGGIFQKDKSVMLVSRGLGIHTIPFRLFDPAEVLVLDFVPDES
ncbi:MAG: metallophosphoesterase, partial [Acetatifactor sp.]|nr:metallophosphoesterase [Acetatifactor sp.]